MKHKAQKALDRLYSLRKGIKNDYPFTEKSKENKYDADDGIVKLINEDKDILQKLVDHTVLKKPEKRYYTSTYGNHGTKKRVDIKCPRCKSVFINGVRSSIGVFEVKEKEFIKTINNQKFCMFCSQAIDWSED